MSGHEPHVVIVGGGISGLATAFYTCTLAAERNIPLRYTVLEADARLGGKIKTERINGCVVEAGPESFVTRKPEALALCRELGLEGSLLGTNDAGRNYVLHHSRPVQVPSTPQGFAGTPLLTWGGKLRAAREMFMPAADVQGDESLGHFLRRRFGNELVDRLIGPAINSIYLSDIDALSGQVSFERFLQLERTHGSVLKGMLAMQKNAKQAQAASPAATRPPQFMTLAGGLGDLVNALAARLQQMGCELRVNAGVNRIDKRGDAQYQIVLNDGKTMTADVVVLATPAPVMAGLIAPHVDQSSAQLRAVRHVDVATITLAYQKTALARPFDGFGVVVPQHENASVLACEAASSKWPNRAPDDLVLFRAFVGGHQHEALVAQSDDALRSMAHKDVSRIFGIQAAPVWSVVYRWQPGNPQYPVNHLAALSQIERRLSSVLPNVHLTGAAMRGLGIPDCVRQAKATATTIINACAVTGQPQTPRIEHA